MKKAERIADNRNTLDIFLKNKQQIESLMTEIATAEKKFATFREELLLFRQELKDYYGFFSMNCENILKCISEN